MSETLTVATETAVAERTIQAVTLEINTLHTQAQQMMLNFAIEIGRRLVEAKDLLDHGQWGDWLRAETEFSKSTANNLMRIFQEYGDQQYSLFGAQAKSQALGDLTYTQALKLLALPQEEREDFVENHDLETLSTRELEKAIAEKKLAESEATKFKKDATRLQEEKDRLMQKMEDSWDVVRDLEKALETLEKTPKEVETITVVDETAVEQARKEEKQRYSQEIQELLEDKAMAESQAKEAREALEAWEATPDQQEVKAALTALEEDKEEALAKATALEQQLAYLTTQASPNVAIFKVHFTQAQEHINQMATLIQTMTTTDPQGADKLRKALATVLKTTLQVVGEGV